MQFHFLYENFISESRFVHFKSMNAKLQTQVILLASQIPTTLPCINKVVQYFHLIQCIFFDFFEEKIKKQRSKWFFWPVGVNSKELENERECIFIVDANTTIA